jgi:hypothetical protein
VRPLADPRHTLIRDPDQRKRPGNGGTTIASRLQSPERRSPASGSGQLRRDRVPDWCSARLKSPTSPRSCLPRRPTIGLRDFRRSAGADGRPPWYPPNREKRSESARGTSSRIRQSRDARRRRRSVADVDELGVALICARPPVKVSLWKLNCLSCGRACPDPTWWGNKRWWRRSVTQVGAARRAERGALDRRRAGAICRVRAGAHAYLGPRPGLVPCRRHDGDGVSR